MASNITKTPLIRCVATRRYAQLAPVSGVPNYQWKSNVLQSKLVVASAENESPITRISIVLRAGTRYESPDELGITHVLRTAAGLSTRCVTQFAITRNIQQVGASLFATSDRETIAYTLEGTRSAVEKVLPFLTEVVTQQVFKPWELSEITNRLQIDIATRSLQLRAVDLLHNAAFRTGLGNSLFIPKNKIGKISSESLQHYVANYFLTGRAAVVGLGVDSAQLEDYAKCLTLDSGEGCETPSPYKGGELRSNKGGDLAFVAIGGEGAPLKNSKEALAFAVLKGAVGAGPKIKWSSRDNGLLTKFIGAPNEEYASTAINASYSDTGLFGILLAVPAKCGGKIVESAVKFFKAATITDEDVARGKNQLKTSLFINAENGAKAVEFVGRRAAIIRDCVQGAGQLAETVDSISTADVQNALQKVGKKISIASIGNLGEIPYLDEIK